jgi:hypothetical protein
VLLKEQLKYASERIAISLLGKRPLSGGFEPGNTPAGRIHDAGMGRLGLSRWLARTLSLEKGKGE